jgi:head-tail adaptor
MSRIRTADLRHKIVVCASDEVITAAGTMRLDRRSAFDSWAKIEAKASHVTASDGGVVAETDKRTHRITMRARPDKIIGTAAWIYEDLRLSPPQWFKILGWKPTGDNNTFWALDVRLVQQSDVAVPLAAKPSAPALPHGLSL